MLLLANGSKFVGTEQEVARGAQLTKGFGYRGKTGWAYWLVWLRKIELGERPLSVSMVES